MRRRREAALVLAAAGLVAVAAHHPTADVRIITHVASDPSPARFQAAVDLGLLGVSILYTWTRPLG